MGWRRSDANNGRWCSKKPMRKILSACARPTHARSVTDCGMDQQAQRNVSDREPKVENSLMTGIEQKNGFHNCPITNDQPSGRGIARGENKLSEDVVV